MNDRDKDKDKGKSKDVLGLKRLRNPEGAGIRVEHPEWSRPNQKTARRIKQRIAIFDAAGDKSAGGHLMHRPGSGRKPR